MKILLAAPLLRLDDLAFNRQQIVHSLARAQSEAADLLLFGEASLPGFEALNFDYARDIRKVLSLHSPEIAELQHAARSFGVALGFGFYENHQGAIHSSYLVLDQSGGIADLYRRVSPGWKEPGACADYREGTSFHTFSLLGKRFAVLVCGDLWEPHLLTAITALDEEADAFFWPVHVDIERKDWEEENLDFSDPANLSHFAYAHQSALLSKPVLFINNQVGGAGRACGGLYHWEQGRTRASLPPGHGEYLLTQV